MSDLLMLVAVVVAIPFLLVVLVGAPFVPTLRPQLKKAIDNLDLKEGMVLFELGCGDGRVAQAAARRGIRVEGYELNPFLALIAWMKTRRFGRLIKIHCRSYWSAPLQDADAIYVFTAGAFAQRLSSKIKRECIAKPVTIVSLGFAMNGLGSPQSDGPFFVYRLRPLPRNRH